MVDRLEELLAMMENENETEDEREDGPALRLRTLPAVSGPEEDEGEAGTTREARLDVPVEQDAGETAAESGPERWDKLAWAADGDPVTAAEAVRRRELARELADAAGVLRTAEIGGAEDAAARGNAGTERELGTAVKHEAKSGLEALYRQTVQASRPAAPQAAPVEQAGRTFRAEEPGRTAALTVDELDRAVRRDSRRYDGGMTIF